MSDVELVIKIPERDYYLACKYSDALIAAYAHYIKEGTLLPKGHGRLGDLDALREEVSSWGMNDYEPSDFTDEIDRTDAIIEADKGESEVLEDGNDD